MSTLTNLSLNMMHEMFRRAILCCLLSACLSYLQPIHISQSSQIEAYSQEYRLCNRLDDWRSLIVSQLLAMNKEQNPNKLEDFRINGTVYILMHLIPGDVSRIMIEGYGWHKLFHGPMGNVVENSRASDANEYGYLLRGLASFHITSDDPVPIDSLRHGSVIVRAIVHSTSWTWGRGSTSEIDPPPIHNDADLYIRVYLRKLHEGVYMIDYDRKHDIGFDVSRGGNQANVVTIGHMTFLGSRDGRYILDVRHLDTLPIRKDYRALIEKKSGLWLGKPRGKAIDWPTDELCPWYPSEHAR